MTTVYVLFREVPHEFGEVRGVFASRRLAIAALDEHVKLPFVYRSELDVQEHEVLESWPLFTKEMLL